MSASLPMYWRAETAQAWRGFWADVQAACTLPLPALTPPEALPAHWTEHWRDPALILSQTCSLPLRTTLRDQVSYVGTFDFGLGRAGYYKSVYIQRPDAPEAGGTRIALNGFDSQSGWAGTRFASLAHPASYVLTGSHAASLAAVAEGRADVAAIDAVTWRLLARHDPNAARVVTAGVSPETPGLPLVTAKGRDPAPLRAALRQACDSSPWIGHPDLGGLAGFCVLDEAAYHRLPVPELPVEFRGT